MSLVKCAKCMKDFDWDQAYNQEETPGAHMHKPPGYGNFWPKAFCPHCGSLVAEWDVDRYQNRDRWKWYGKNVKVNAGRELPPEPLTLWGRSIPSDARVTVPEDHIDIKLVIQLLGEGGPEEVKEAEKRAEVLSPEQIFTNANEELDSYFKSRGRSFDRREEAFENLKSYIEGKGKSDAKAIALFGMIEYFDGNRDAAREMFEQAMTLDESCAICHFGLGILDFWDADTAKRGVERLSKAITLDSSLIHAYVWKAIIQKQKLNDPQGAWNTLQEAVSALGEDQLKKHPRGHFLFLELGELCVFDNLGVVNDAIRYFEIALQMNPNSYDAPMYLMHIYKALGKSSEVSRTKAAYERADQGFGLSSEAIDTIRRFVAKSVETQVLIGHENNLLGGRPEWARMASTENIHGWSAQQVRALQKQTAQALDLAVEFRDKLKDNSRGPVMVVIPSGRFLMGSPENELGRFNYERQHEVEVASFAIGRYAVTFEEYDRFAEATKRDKPVDVGWGRGRRPVISVTWFDAVAYAGWLSEQTGRPTDCRRKRSGNMPAGRGQRRHIILVRLSTQIWPIILVFSGRCFQGFLEGKQWK